MSNSFISKVRATMFVRGVSDASNTELDGTTAPMQVLSLQQLRHVVGGDDNSVDGSPKGSWKATPSDTAA